MLRLASSFEFRASYLGFILASVISVAKKQVGIDSYRVSGIGGQMKNRCKIQVASVKAGKWAREGAIKQGRRTYLRKGKLPVIGYAYCTVRL